MPARLDVIEPRTRGKKPCLILWSDAGAVVLDPEANGSRPVKSQFDTRRYTLIGQYDLRSVLLDQVSQSPLGIGHDTCHIQWFHLHYFQLVHHGQ